MEQDLEVLEGDPLAKWGEILLHASPKRSLEELERFLEWRALGMLFLEQEGLEDKFETLLKQLKFDPALQEKVHARKIDLAVQSMTAVLSGHE
ncbi:DUF2018 family protein [Helicobacter heilmannii]|uniref:Putative n=1 Tax=Helicobacter heilmannii TaxID=35817 RepID=A0A0K2XZQ8_HELHE|nr:DUF2018 family protein [Helicobacter heilmannii]CCM11753.1 hypothetical protein BN341_820 [Helicobacter heilmannii ASB1.4]CRF45325.1 hypothetical protein HHE014_02870 [Helicobacter heilmannii]CRF46768.1 hypothetical protein HHE02_00320 [Helicobacter heilmannii]CRF51567.1 hypothetical protein HHE06_14540 [Helicobacter heilmannii]CRI33892.1 putative [Helicobacter heilmannii]